MVLLRHAGDRVADVGAVQHLVGVVPQTQLEPQAAELGLVADEAQRRQVLVALLVRHAPGADVVAGDVQQEGVGEAEVVVDRVRVVRVVVLHPEGELQPVDAVGRQLGEVLLPELAVVEPGHVLDVADEAAGDAAHGRGGTLTACRHLAQGSQGRVGEGDDVGQVEQAVGEAWTVRATDGQDLLTLVRPVDDERFGCARDGSAAGRQLLGHRAPRKGHHDPQRRAGLSWRADPQARRRQSGGQMGHGPLGGRILTGAVVGLHHHVHRLRCGLGLGAHLLIRSGQLAGHCVAVRRSSCSRRGRAGRREPVPPASGREPPGALCWRDRDEKFRLLEDLARLMKR